MCAAVGLATTADLASPTLRCGEATIGAAPGATCVDGSECEHRLCLLSGYCAQSCVDDDDCPTRAACGPAFVLGRGRTHPMNACLVQPASDDITRYEVSTAILEPSETEVTVTLAPTAQPAVYVVEYQGPLRWPFGMTCRPPLCPLTLSARQTPRKLLFDATVMDAPSANPLVPWPFAYPQTVYIGNGDAPPYDSEGYDLTLSTAGTSTADSDAPPAIRITQVRSAADTPVGPLHLDVDVYYVGAALAPSGARGEAPLAAALAEVERIFTAAEITLGKVRQLQVPGAILQAGLTFEDEDPRAGFQVLQTGYGLWPELPALLRLSAGSYSRAINLFLVSDIAGMGDGEVQALAGGIPGPLGIHGTGASGVAIATDMFIAQPQRLGRTIAHEIAHFLGLLHTTEGDGSSLEALADTPLCPAAAEADGDGQLSSPECADHDGDNLMFWSQATGISLSPSQVRVLRQAPILY